MSARMSDYLYTHPYASYTFSMPAPRCGSHVMAGAELVAGDAYTTELDFTMVAAVGGTYPYAIRAGPNSRRDCA